MTDVTIREIQDLRELSDPPAPRPEPDPDDEKAAREAAARGRARADRPSRRSRVSQDSALGSARLGLGFRPPRFRLPPGFASGSGIRARPPRPPARQPRPRARPGSAVSVSGCSSSGVHSGTWCPRRSSSFCALPAMSRVPRGRVRPCLILLVRGFQPAALAGSIFRRLVVDSRVAALDLRLRLP